jgi:hypothetical protein
LPKNPTKPIVRACPKLEKRITVARQHRQIGPSPGSHWPQFRTFGKHRFKLAELTIREIDDNNKLVVASLFGKR